MYVKIKNPKKSPIYEHCKKDVNGFLLTEIWDTAFFETVKVKEGPFIELMTKKIICIEALVVSIKSLLEIMVPYVIVNFMGIDVFFLGYKT